MAEIKKWNERYLDGDNATKPAAMVSEINDLREALLAMRKDAGWISVDERLPADETPVIILLNGEAHIGELCWETPGWEETYEAFCYWDNPHDDGQDWQWHDITHWMPLPAEPEVQP